MIVKLSEIGGAKASAERATQRQVIAGTVDDRPWEQSGRRRGSDVGSGLLE